MVDAAREKTIEEWSQALYEAQRDHLRIPAPSPRCGVLSLFDAYEVQARVTARRVEAGERQVGWKVGATSFAILEKCNIRIEGICVGCILRSLVSACKGERERERERVSLNH